MKQILLAMGLASCTLPAFAQHSHEHNYNVSVFSGSGPGSINTEYQKAIDASVKINFPGWYVDIEKNNGRFSDLYGKAMDVPGNGFEAKALGLMNGQLKDLGIITGEWQKVRDAEAPKAHYVDFEQRINGHEVIFARLSFRFTKDGKIERIKNRAYGNHTTVTAPTLTREQVAQSNALTTGVGNATIAKTEVAATWAWFPVPAANGYALRPVWEVTVVGTNGEREPLHLNGFIDGVTGELLYRTDEVKTIDVHVKGNVYKNGYSAGTTLEPIPDMEVMVNGIQAYTDLTGTVSSSASSVNLDMALAGKWSTVYDDPTGVTPTFSVNGITSTQDVVFPNTTVPGGPQHVNAFYHVTIVHDFMKERLPAFTDFDFALETNVDVAGSCNAFYSGFGSNNSINFYAAGGSCKSFALIGDVVYHEYGHGIARIFYADQGANSMRNGALNEGQADVWALGITKGDIIGDQAIGTGYIRRYDQNPKVYPQDIEGEVHADGEIIAGAWWDVAQAIGYDTMSRIFANTFYDVPDGPNGMEGMVYHEVLISALMNDDDDNNLGNGSPHFEEIVEAFAKHGIYLYADVKLNHQELAHQPANTPITVNASLAITNPMFFDKLQLIYRNRTLAAWDTLDMTDNGGGNFTAQIPAQPAGSLLDYFFYIYDVLDIPTVSYPNGYNPDPLQSQQVTIPYQFAVGISPRMQIDFEQTATDWQVGNSSFETATAGKWIQAAPIASYFRPNGGAFGSFICQTTGDHTTGSGKCLVTGNSAAVNNSPGSTDVDGGTTAVVTPAFDLTGYTNPIIEYYRWYSNNYSASGEGQRRNDIWRVSMKWANSSIWREVESTLQSDTAWRRRIFAVDQYLAGARQGVQLRFFAQDAVQSTATDQGQSVVEAAVDDFFIYDGVPTGIADIAPAKAMIYPNPADNVVKIQLEQGAEGTIALYDLSGRAISSIAMNKTTMTYEMNTAGVASGVYMLIVQTGKSIQSQKITVNHQ